MEISEVVQNTRRVRALVSADEVRALIVAAVAAEVGLPPDAKVVEFDLVRALGGGWRAEVVLLEPAR